MVTINQVNKAIREIGGEEQLFKGSVTTISVNVPLIAGSPHPCMCSG